jgi:acyl carrier protein phosphodiesterase
MNWLAHLHLSEPNPEFRLGNLLADIATKQSLASLPAAFQRGITQHRRIDAFTDSHPLAGVSRALQRIGSRLRRPVDFSQSVLAFERDYDSFHSDFRVFFPELSSHVCSFPRPVEKGKPWASGLIGDDL